VKIESPADEIGFYLRTSADKKKGDATKAFQEIPAQSA